MGYEPKPGHTVVEIGCGAGRPFRVIASEVERLHATDISAEMIARAKAHNLSNVDLSIGNGFSLHQFSSAAANLALAYCVFQHLPSVALLRGYLSEMGRVTKSGGLIALTLVPTDWNVWLEPMAALKKRILPPRGPKGITRRNSVVSGRAEGAWRQSHLSLCSSQELHPARGCFSEECNEFSEECNE